MTFDELEVGKEYVSDQTGARLLILGKASEEIAVQWVSVVCPLAPFQTFSHRATVIASWRPYVPPPAPVVRCMFAVYSNDEINSICSTSKEYATTEPLRIGPVVRVELLIDPDMLAKVSK